MSEAVKGTGIEVRKLITKYPQGAEKQLIFALEKRVVPSGGLPLDVGVVVDNVGTAYAVYEAVGADLLSRGITVRASRVNHPRTSWPESEPWLRIDIAGGRRDEVIFGGPMMGMTVLKIDVPVVKTSNNFDER